jgi:NADPH-dependent 2,4-dienoyl-CoA reductase/sulfur reductase-like enzyme
VAEGTRAEGRTGEIVLVGDEPRLPYDRPPLSKQSLNGGWQADRLALRSRADLDSLGLKLMLGPRARAAGVEAGAVAFDEGMSWTTATWSSPQGWRRSACLTGRTASPHGAVCEEGIRMTDVHPS